MLGTESLSENHIIDSWTHNERVKTMIENSSNHPVAVSTKRHIKTVLLFVAAIGVAVISCHSGKRNEARSGALRERHAQVQACI